jgi:1-deoxy-D-xylulose-5-phosphate reductoisomerase
LGSLEFEELDEERFPAVSLARDAGKRGGSYPAVLNAANEVAVHAFLTGAISFTAIAEVVSKVLALHQPVPVDELPRVIEVDSWARGTADGVIASAKGRATSDEPVLGKMT